MGFLLPFLLALFTAPALGACDDFYAKMIQEVDPAQAANLTPEAMKMLTSNFMVTNALIKAGGGNIPLWNKTLFDHLDKIPFVARNPKRKAGFTLQEQTALFRKVKNHPVASNCYLDKYDPKGQMGFCFGRAASVHIEALRDGIHKEMVKKLWAVGPMENNSGFWQYHVSTMVRDTKGEWIVIDPIMGFPEPFRDWAARMEKLSTDKLLQFFVSDPKRLFPNQPKGYSKEYFSDPDIEVFFRDLMKKSRDDSKH